jgi:hypothetical protein
MSMRVAITVMSNRLPDQRLKDCPIHIRKLFDVEAARRIKRNSHLTGTNATETMSVDGLTSRRCIKRLFSIRFLIPSTLCCVVLHRY